MRGTTSNVTLPCLSDTNIAAIPAHLSSTDKCKKARQANQANVVAKV